MASFPFSFPAATAPASATGVDSQKPAFTLPPKVTPAQAYDAILQPASPPLRDRPEEAARRALECAEELIRSASGETFGWHRRQKREGLLDDQLALLRHFARQDTVFGDAITLQGIRAGSIPSIITAQPEADQGRPSQADVDAFLWQSGFIRLPDEMMMVPYSHKPFWWRPAGSILVGDSNPENYSRISDDIIVPIDVISHPFPRSLIEQTARQNGVSLDRLVAQDARQREAFDRRGFAVIMIFRF